MRYVGKLYQDNSGGYWVEPDPGDVDAWLEANPRIGDAIAKACGYPDAD